MLCKKAHTLQPGRCHLNIERRRRPTFERVKYLRVAIAARQMKHCPICNRSSEEARFYGEFCEFCLGKKLREKLPTEIEVEQCKDCGRIKVAGAFVPETKVGVESLLSRVYRPYKIRLIHSGNGIARMLVTDENQGGLSVEHNAHLKIRRTLCGNDAKKRSGYYEAVVQFRGDAGRVGRAVASLERYLEKNDAFVTKAEEKEHGVDVFVSDKRVALSFITVRHMKWKGSFELHGEKRGRRLYRNTYFIAL
jgi:NMD protein affecting ribosome stability and mRNA decay